VTGHLTGFVWVQWMLCFKDEWQAALDHVKTLADGQCGLADGSVAGDWRLPNVRELSSITDYSENGPALPSGHPFTPSGVSGPTIWSSTSDVREPVQVFGLNLDNGGISMAGKMSKSIYAWAVRDAPPPPGPCSNGMDIGCLIVLLCLCDGPQGTMSAWKNHGKYVSCTAHAAKVFLSQGLITGAE